MYIHIQTYIYIHVHVLMYMCLCLYVFIHMYVNNPTTKVLLCVMRRDFGRAAAGFRLKQIFSIPDLTPPCGPGRGSPPTRNLEGVRLCS